MFIVRSRAAEMIHGAWVPLTALDLQSTEIVFEMSLQIGSKAMLAKCVRLLEDVSFTISNLR